MSNDKQVNFCCCRCELDTAVNWHRCELGAALNLASCLESS